MGTATKQPTKKEVRLPAKQQVTRCPVCHKTVALATLKAHMGSANCR
jgi:hypothetical protein